MAKRKEGSKAQEKEKAGINEKGPQYPIINPGSIYGSLTMKHAMLLDSSTICVDQSESVQFEESGMAITKSRTPNLIRLNLRDHLRCQGVADFLSCEGRESVIPGLTRIRGGRRPTTRGGPGESPKPILTLLAAKRTDEDNFQQWFEYAWALRFSDIRAIAGGANRRQFMHSHNTLAPRSTSINVNDML